MNRRYGLRDDQWARIEHLLPGRVGHVGGTARDNRRFVEAVLYRYRAGIPWRGGPPGSMPERFDGWKATHTCFSRWARSGVWERVFAALSADADNEYALLDATIVRAHQHSAGARKRGAATRRSGGAEAAVIPPKRNRTEQREYDAALYEARHLIEHFFCKLKQFRAIATRYDKTACNFLAAVYLAGTAILLN